MNQPHKLNKKMHWFAIAAAGLVLSICWLASDGGHEITTAASGHAKPTIRHAVSEKLPQIPRRFQQAADPKFLPDWNAPAFEAAASSFRDWLDTQPIPLDPLRLEEGRTLLETRRAAMVSLIQNDPRRALEQALSFAERERLPAEWLPLVEERFSTLADLSVLPDCSPESTGISHITLERHGQPMLQGVAWGELAGHQSKNKLPVEGIALDGWTVMQENGVKVVSGREKEAVERLFPTAAATEAVDNAEVTALIGGQVHHFATAEAAGEIQDLYSRIAALPGPRSASPLTAALADSSTLIPTQIFTEAQALASSWTETPKTVLVLNTVFPDKTTPVGTQAQWQTVMTEVSNWISDVSYGKTSLVVTVPPNIFMLPYAGSFYERGSNLDPITDATVLALAAGINPENYDITVVAFPEINVGYGGLAVLGGSRQWLNGTRKAGLIAHEFGHNYGLNHASSWDANDGSILPATGAPDSNDSRHNEYGDLFSVMGLGVWLPDDDYSMQGKAQLNWITPTQIQTVTVSGTYRIHRFDASTANSNPKLALKLQREDSQTFWLGYRRRFDDNNYLKNGAYIIWEYTPNRCRLLDMTPETRIDTAVDGDRADGALAIGRTFTDPTKSLYITPTAQGGTAPNEWLDVRVEFTVAGNNPPTASINLPAQPVAARTSVTLTANATDQDNDPLICVWDFGNGHIARGASVNWIFYAGGSRQVTLRVNDGKGGLAEVTQTITVSDPLAQIEEISLPDSTDRVDNAGWLGGLQVGSRFYENKTYASVDGATWLSTAATLNFNAEGFASGAGRLVAVGERYNYSLSKSEAASAVTTETSAWTEASHGATPPLRAVAFRNGLFVAVGDAGTLLTSPDGSVWTPRTNPTASSLYGVTTNGTGFLACGQDDTIITSPDGMTWTQRISRENGFSLREIAASGTKAVAVNGDKTYYYSSDSGATWVLRQFNLRYLHPTGIVFGEGVWVASQYPSDSPNTLTLAVSTDGLRWEELAAQPLPSYSRVRLMDGRIWVYGQSGKILRSGLIKTGNRAPTLTPAWPAAMTARVTSSLNANVVDADGDATEVLWEIPGSPYRFGSPINHTFLMGGTKTLTARASDSCGGHTPATRTYEVVDPLLYWSNITPATFSGTSMTLSARSSNRVVIAGYFNSADAPLATATSSTAWTKRNLPIYASGLAWRSPGFVAVGQGYDSTTSSWRGAVSRSTDGQVWGASQYLTGNALRSVTASDNDYVAVGDGGIIFRSSDGLTWNAAPSGVTTMLTGVAFAGARGLAVGSGKVLLSEDAGATWTDVTTDSGSAFYASRVFSAGGRLYLSGQVGKLRVYEPATRTWLDGSASGSVNFGNLQSVVLSGSTYVAIGLQYDSALGRNRRSLAVSLDGITWEAGEMLWPADPVSLLDCEGNLLVTGSNMLLAIGQSTPGLAVLPTALTTSRGTGETGLLGTIQIGNTGAGSLNWTVSSNASWLAATATAGSVTVSSTPVNVTMLSALPAGTNTGTLTFSAPGVPSQQVTVTVNAYVDDHANTIAAATSLTPDTAIAGNIQGADDSDWFTFELTAPGTFKVWTTGTLDTMGELHGSTGLLATSNDFNGGKNFQIERVLLPGRYWVKVDGYSTNTGAYQLESTFTPAGPPFTLKSWSLAPGGTQGSFTVATAIGYRYYVERSSSLVGGWTQVGSVITATAEESIITIPVDPASKQMFFRIAILAP